ncbi:acetolactate synthase isozyme1 large subunit [Roseobacter sp. YSTF-M11]|uniref:Acetolactate synthase isozyme1 large subunit n=1 Tax=Roseobacter insulae TaxID=2859783 RepID=A0A9X1FZZ0_9RHOB|nr:thiamine pyrophosphate-binding protein [Roseobacter insulae]MBW4710522.1 acetolactate synthase isozyme1 large subunit [Roseobacter insulae]
MQRPLGAQISHMLRARGVEVIFGIPGVHNQEMYRGIEEAGITHVLARHEQGAGFMADGYARATGKPGVAYVITGPGLCNIMTPMGQAYSDSVPLLVLSSCLDEIAAKKGQLHQMKGQRAAAATVCDWSEEARTANAAYGLIDRAFAEFQTQSPLPKHIQVPIAVLQAPADPAPFRDARVRRMGADPRDVATAVQKLKKAQRPLFILGGGAKAAAPQARSVLEKLGAASYTTYAGRGIAGSEDPLHLGAMLENTSSIDVLRRADLLVFVGTDLAEVDFYRPELGHTAPAIHVNMDVAVLSRAAVQDDRHLADATAWFSAVESKLQGHQTQTLWRADEVAEARARGRSEVDAGYPGISAVCDALRAAVPADTMIYSDMTQIAYTAKKIWDMDRPGHWHHPSGFGTLGYATPAAIGGAVARRGKPTMAIIGDYGFHYTMQELGVAVELGLSLPIILWDNGKLKEIEDSMVRSQIAPNAVVARNPDFCMLAEAFGAKSAAPQSLRDMQQAVNQAFEEEGPTLIYTTPDLTR